MDAVNAAAAPPTRRARAQATRSRIIDAAAAVFSEFGYAGTTMHAVADRAGVAVQTVYFVFHTKAELLVETLRVIGGGPEPTPDVMARSWIGRVFAAPDGAARLAIVCEEGSLIYLRLAPLLPAVVAAAPDPEVRAAWQRIVDDRREGIRRMTGLMAARGELREGLSAGLAADVLFGLHRYELYLAFTREAGWSFDRWRAWTYLTLCTQLLPQEAASAALDAGSPALEGLELATAIPELGPLLPFEWGGGRKTGTV